jgi:hypothetical protein
MSQVIDRPTITITHLSKVADREDFLVQVSDEGSSYEFRVSMTGTILAIWNRSELDEIADLIVDRLVYSHGTARAFRPEGYWFDSNNSSDTLDQTLHDIITRGADDFLHPFVGTGVAKQLYEVIDNLDRDCTAVMNHFFCKSLDELSERSRLSEDFESQARDQGRFVYLVCIPAAIIDRFNFTVQAGA